MPGRRFGNATIRGQAEVDWIVDRIWAGDSPADAAADWDLTEADALVACWYVGAHSRSRRARDMAMRKWAEDYDNVFEHLWRAEYDKVPPPPTKGGSA